MADAQDDLFYSRVRLVVVAELLQAEWVAFTDLQRSTDATRGNLGSHLGKLVDGGIIEEDKRFVRGRPMTRYRLTARGRSAFLRHIEQVDQLFRAARREYGEAERSPQSVDAPIVDPQKNVVKTR